MKANIARLVANGVGEELALLDSVRQTEAPRRNSRIPERQEAAARMPGIHLEGPFLSPERPGVHPPQHIRPLSEQAAADLVQDAVRLMTVAPEQDESGQAIAYLQKHGVRVSLGHSNANFAEAQQAFDRGVRLMTHTFNALPPVQHRAPGAVTAALLDERVYCCVIADGLHLDPEIVRLIYKIKGPSKTILVTDRAHVGTSQGGLVGSSLTLEQAVRNVVKWGIASFADAITMATVTPAAALGLDFALGHLSPGKLADFVVWDANTLEIKQVAVGGRLVF
jgi:N-acetylglucosamine-6-phosphate deacetylase